MSARSGIVNALVEKLKEVKGQEPYKSNLYDNVIPKLKFWDEVNDYPFVCVVAAGETREYLPANFKWGFLSINIKVYVRDENSIDALEKVLADIETVIDANQELVFADGTRQTEEVNITSIKTDEGLLDPLGIADISLVVRYQVL